MKNGRCKLHGGKSTGPKTEEGKAKIAAAQWKHGRCSKTHKQMRKIVRVNMKSMMALAEELGEKIDWKGM
jgi:hypothetical protein